MNKVKAFVGYSFDDKDESVVRKFLNYFSTLSELGLLEWDDAKKVEAKAVSEKVKEKMKGKNVFIGIFTAKKMQIQPSKLKENTFFKKNCFSVLKTDFQWSTSEWIIQESGYALGKEMTLMFLVEDGLTDLRGLQGNIELIPFSRRNPELCFCKINEIISSLVKQQAKTGEEVIEKSKPQEITKTEKTLEETPLELKEEETKDIIGKLISAIKNGDEKTEVALYEKKLKECEGNKDKEINFKSLYYAIRHNFKAADELENLLKLSQDNPEYSQPHYWRGVLLENYHDYEKAYDEFSQAAIKSKDDIDKTANLCKASTALIKAKKYTQAREIILKRFQEINKNSTREHVELLKTLAKIELAEGKTDRYFSFCENALKLNPSDADLRFELASTYSKYDKHSSSLHHYKILSENVPNSAKWNNLGVVYSNLELGGKAVAAYLKSKEAGGTTSVGNLAHRLIDAGFLNEARSTLQEALKKPDFDTNVPKALSSIEEVIEAETKKEEETLSSTIKEREFLIEYAEAFIEPFEIRLPLSWKTKYGDIDIKIEGNRFVAKREKNIEPTLSLLGFNPYRKRTSDEEMILQKITYQGTIVNRTIDYELTIDVEPVRKFNEATLAGRLLGTKKEKDVYTGIMVINREFNKIEVMEKEPKGNVSFYEMTSNDNC
ncbi:MAG: hypothetical protein Q7J76_08830 [Candidatus Brocadiaceae bacterium]|uniref:tetratricopeptide repeat protein n=1 Tax=Candidatus Wunengus sp. YC61 TaxID=3367698 RepID=UPI00271A862C|nr:hypothetical protein [Candidatus Brocadiaceae bacterium]